MNDYNLKQRMLASIANLRAVRAGEKEKKYPSDQFILEPLTNEQLTEVEAFIRSFETATVNPGV